jgi:DNA-binding MarR family transcriptional regulator
MTAAHLPLPPLVCACASLRRAARAVTQAYNAELGDAGMNPTQFTLLHFLSRLGEVPQGRLAELLAIDTTTLTRTLETLRKSGWIRARAGDDRRERHWSLTPAGDRQRAEAAPHWEAAQARLRARLGSGRFQSLLSELAAVAEAARDSDKTAKKSRARRRRG